jgi:hypothetical protein
MKRISSLGMYIWRPLLSLLLLDSATHYSPQVVVISKSRCPPESRL